LKDLITYRWKGKKGKRKAAFDHRRRGKKITLTLKAK